ncbi:MAG: helix-turn-helix transcriptional regulator [Vibrio sp.]
MSGINMIPPCFRQTLAESMEPLLHVDKICFLYLCQPVFRLAFFHPNSRKVDEFSLQDAMPLVSYLRFLNGEYGVPNHLTSEQISLFKQLPGYWGCKDLNSVFVYANQAYGQLIGVDSGEECIGRTDFEMPSPTAACAADFQQQDRYVIETGHSVKVLDIHPYPDGHWHAHIFTKTPWRDREGNIQGTIFFGQDLTDTAILEVGHWVCRATGLSNNTEFKSATDRAALKLTARESEVLFLLLYGKKPQHIARVMGISIKTIEGYEAKLRSKFGALSKDQLIDLALDRGFGSVIPKTLLNKQLSVVLSDHTI